MFVEINHRQFGQILSIFHHNNDKILTRKDIRTQSLFERDIRDDFIKLVS